MNLLPDIILMFLTAVNSYAVYLAHRKINGCADEMKNKEPAHSDEEMWTEILDIRSVQNKTLEGMNKWLRKHGRTLQVENDMGGGEARLPKTKKVGMILPNGSR